MEIQSGNQKKIETTNMSFKRLLFYTLPQVYYVFMLAVRVSVRPSVRSPYVRTSFPFDNLSIYERISFEFCVCICIKNISLGIVNGQSSIIYHRVMALVNGQKMLFFFR